MLCIWANCLYKDGYFDGREVYISFEGNWDLFRVDPLDRNFCCEAFGGEISADFVVFFIAVLPGLLTIIIYFYFSYFFVIDFFFQSFIPSRTMIIMTNTHISSSFAVNAFQSRRYLGGPLSQYPQPFILSELIYLILHVFVLYHHRLSFTFDINFPVKIIINVWRSLVYIFKMVFD